MARQSVHAVFGVRGGEMPSEVRYRPAVCMGARRSIQRYAGSRARFNEHLPAAKPDDENEHEAFYAVDERLGAFRVPQ
jgi:hypothetical protein